MTNIEKIERAISESKKFPKSSIEYNLELPEMDGITATSFRGVPAKFNPGVSKEAGAAVMYTY